MSAEQDISHEKLVEDWYAGRPLPPAVKPILDWLLHRFPVGPPLEPFEREALEERARARRWRPQDVERATLLWRLVTDRDRTGKPVA